jgi:L-threonylcarbamoyladenylate synthase
VGLRVPDHPAMQALLRACRRPLAAPSVNASGAISPTRAQHVLKSLGGRIALVIDGGATQRGIESTIVAAAGGPLRLLRRGPLQIVAELASGRAVEAPGQLASHYAPSKPLRLEATQASADEYLIGFGTVEGSANLSPFGDLVEAASRLFDLLHEGDASTKARIAVAPVPHDGLGAAINDRLRRAAAGSRQ